MQLGKAYISSLNIGHAGGLIVAPVHFADGQCMIKERKGEDSMKNQLPIKDSNVLISQRKERQMRLQYFVEG